MADDFERVKDSLDVLNEVFQLGSSFSDASKIITASGALASAIPIVGAILGLLGSFLPDGKHSEIISRFDQLDKKIDRLSRDIEQLRNVIKWDITELQYADHIDNIKLGMTLCSAIGKSRDEKQRTKYRDRLKDFCAKENCRFSLNAILNGVIGSGIFRSSSILDKYYDVTGGSRPRISFLGTRLLQVLCGGTMVLSTYETMVQGKEEAADNTKPVYRQLNEAFNKIKSVLNICMRNFRANMLNDLNVFLDKGGSNRDLVAKISTLMRDKYDWLENYCLVYNDLIGFDKHCYGGHAVSSLHRNGKCGVVFFRTKGEVPKFSNRYDEAYKIVNNAHCANARDCYNTIVTKTNERGIKRTGCAVIKGSPDLWTAGNFTTKIILVNKPHTITISGFWYVYRDITTNGKAILLLK